GKRGGRPYGRLSVLPGPGPVERDGRTARRGQALDARCGGAGARDHPSCARRSPRLCPAPRRMIEDEQQARTFCARRVDPNAFSKLEGLQKLLAEENERQNLVSSASLGAVWQRHFADSL